MRFGQHLLYFLIDNSSRLLAVFLRGVTSARQKQRRALAFESHKTQPLAHAELRDHCPSDLGCFLQIILSPGRDIAEDHFLSTTAAQQAVDPSQHSETGHE